MYRKAVGTFARSALRSSAAPVAVKRCIRPTILTSRPSPRLARTFAVSASRQSHGENDAALSSKLAAELEYENESSSPGSEPEFLTAFKSNGIWTIEDRPGADEVALKRKFGNEEIKVLFSIADIDNGPESSKDEAEDDAAEDAEQQAESAQGESLPIRTAITVSKGKGHGALTIDAVAQDGLFLVDNISFYTDEGLATDLTSEADWKRRGLYMGPAFDHLDENLQNDFEAFLEERGIDSSLALFIPDLAEHKEQTEYVKWLSGVKKFIDA